MTELQGRFKGQSKSAGGGSGALCTCKTVSFLCLGASGASTFPEARRESSAPSFTRISMWIGNARALCLPVTGIVDNDPKGISKLVALWCGTCVLSRVRLFVTPWTVAHQAPLSMWLSRQEYWSVLTFPQPRDQTRVSCVSSTAGRFFTVEPPGKPRNG